MSYWHTCEPKTASFWVSWLLDGMISVAARNHVRRTRQFWLYGCPSDQEPRKSYSAALLVASYNGPDGTWFDP